MCCLSLTKSEKETDWERLLNPKQMLMTNAEKSFVSGIPMPIICLVVFPVWKMNHHHFYAFLVCACALDSILRKNENGHVKTRASCDVM